MAPALAADCGTHGDRERRRSERPLQSSSEPAVVRASRIPIVAGITLLLTAGCEPCSGVANCGTTRAVHVEGRIVDQATGKSVPDAQVSIALQGGASATG